MTGLAGGDLVQKILNGNYTIGQRITNISLKEDTVSISEQKKLSPVFEPSNAAYKTVAWSTSDAGICEITNDGVLKPKKDGKVTITCAALDGSGVTASCVISVISLQLNKENLDMYIGQNYTLEGWIGKTCVDCSFKSSNSKIVSVDKKGKLTAKKAGSATITATASKSRGKATCVVTVHPKPTKVSIKQGSSKTLNIGDSLALSITYAPKDALAKVTWSTSNKKVANVSSAGKVTALKEGTATISAKVSGMNKGGSSTQKIKITVIDPNKPTGISISSPSKTVEMGETLQLSATLKPKTAQSDVSWKSSNTKIAKVNKKGVVTPVKVGNVTITATAAKKSPKGKVVSATIKISVKKSTAPTSISVGTAEKTLHVGDQWQLDYKIKPAGAKASLTFSSSDEAVATVNEKGVITANAEGSATITVVTQNNKKASCKVTVLAEASGLQLDKESLSLNVGDTYQLTCFVSYGLSGSVTFSSSNAAVATVDANALITAVGVGEATITASMDNGAIATCMVTVSDPDMITQFGIDEPDTITLKVGESYRIKTILEPASAKPDILWSISKDGILDEWWTAYACIAADGTITALKEGEKTIYARVKRDGMDDLVRSVKLKIEPSGSTTQLYDDGVLRVLGVINNHREDNEVAMVTIDGSLCEIARQQLDQIISGGGNTIPDSYSWILHSDLPYSADDIYMSLNMRVELKQEAKDICFDPSIKYAGIAVGFKEPWWGYALAIFQ